MKYTPGLSIVKQPDGSDYAIMHGLDIIGEAYAQCGPTTMSPSYPAGENAQLWAAAPEMYEACSSHGQSCGLARDGPDLLEKAADMLEKCGLAGLVPSLRIKAHLERAALAKARGEGE